MNITKKNKIDAGSTAYRGHILPRETPQAMLQRMEALILAAGYTMRTKGSKALKARMTTTDPVTRTVWLKHGWESRTIDRQATTLAHEYVHILQHRAHVDAKRDEKTGLASYALKYARPRGRWVIEMQAYAVSILAARSLGVKTDAMPQAIADTLWKNYKPWFPFMKRELINATIEVLGGV